MEAASTALFDFDLPAALEAGAPPEARGLARDEVRLLVSHRRSGALVHSRFRELPHFLSPGDVLAINTSGTLNAALPAWGPDGRELELHLSTRLPGDLWSVELRHTSGGRGTEPWLTARAGDVFRLPAGAAVTLLTPQAEELRGRPGMRVRLWLATLSLPEPVHYYLERHGFPIRYGYVQERWPSSYYQTAYANEPGSAEMPSAGRGFTPELITRLVAGGVQFAPLVLHTGVASLEDHEPPYEEQYRVPAESARVLNAARGAGRRVIAVGTTVVRALESVTDPDGVVHPGEGWTRLVIAPDRCVRSVDGLLTGFHEPRATHLAMLSAVAGQDELCAWCTETDAPLPAGWAHLRETYAEALRERYLWHEFGDLHLLLP
jgi:S-adenosylmethionine:tRNA ribosyltransferase-isomerase